MVLADGAQATIRPIAPGDKPFLVEGLAALSRRSVHQRFLAAKPRFSTRELRYLTEVDGVRHIALVALRPAGPRPLLGVARCVRLAAEPATAEMAVVVQDDVQGRGLGRALAQALRDAAWAGGVRRFVATMLADNAAARRLLLPLARDFVERRLAGGLLEVQAELIAPGREAADR